jgi:hypothetical protein
MCLICSLYGFARWKFGIRRVSLRIALQILFEEPQIILEDFLFFPLQVIRIALKLDLRFAQY